MSAAIFPYLRDIFPDENYDCINDILDGVPSDIVIKIASFINTKLYINDRYITQREIFNTIVFQNGIENPELINENLLKFEKKNSGNELALFPLYITMQLIQHEISNYRVKDELPNPLKELAILKAILFLNTNLDKQHTGQKYNKGIHFFWGAVFPQFEYRKNKNPINEMFLAFSLFEFLERRFPAHFSNYLKLNNCENSKEFLKEILNLLAGSFNNETKLQSCSFSNDSFNRTSILSSFIRDISALDLDDYVKQRKHLYFKGLREKPILKLLDGSFVVFNWNFISDKVRQGVIFDFYNNSAIGEEYSFDTYKSIIGQEFSEKDLFESLIRELYKNDSKAVMFSEDVIKDWNFDFYIRYDNKILLFEFKDVTIREEVKNSSGDRIWEELKKKLVKNEKGRQKGITQLTSLISKLNTKPDWIENFIDIGMTKENLIIIPIILFTDESLAIPGVNKELSEVFKQQLTGNDFFMVYSPVMIGVNCIVEYLYHLQGSPQKLISLIHDYYLNRVTYKLRDDNSNASLVFENMALSFDLYLAKRFGSIDSFEDSVSLKVVKNKLGLK